MSPSGARRMSLTVSAILDRPWARDLRRFSGGRRSGGELTVRYWLGLDAGVTADGVPTDPLSRAEANSIRRTLERVDRLTGLRFVEKRSPRQAVITVQRVPAYPDSGLLGETVRLRDRFSITWENRNGNRLGREERATITHELGHPLGLGHPNGRPWAFRYDTDDTIMSYNQGLNTGFTSLDLRALQRLWPLV
jgi:hypothetical protein